MKKVALIAAAAILMSACATVTITKRGVARSEAEPTYRRSQDFFLWGLVGGPHEVDATEICGSKREAVQLQAQHTVGDVVLTLLTVGIYAPRSAKVWCL